MIRIIDWYHNVKNKQWITIEEDIIGLQLKSLPRIKPQFRPEKKELTIFVSATLGIRDTVLKKGELSTMIGPMTLLFSNPEFPLAIVATMFIKWNRVENRRIVQTLVDGRLP